jgi:RNA polymerase sigma-70 factor (ECF subfamily)
MNAGFEPDEWLMGQVALGKRECLETLVARYAGPLLTFLRRMTGDHHRCEEFFQEAFLSVWINRRQYKTTAPFKPWLYAIAANRCRAEFRRKRLPGLATLDEARTAGSSDFSPETKAIRAETVARVKQAVAELPVQQRTVVSLRIWNQLSFAEIAQVMGKTEGTVRSHMHHGLSALRKSLGEAVPTGV